MNVDLELESPAILQPLADYLASDALVLHCGAKPDGSYHLAVEPVIEGRLNSDPAACTEHLLRLLECLPGELVALWQACSFRAFDYGFDGGLEHAPIAVQLEPAQLQRITRLGLALRITVYPFRGRDGESPDQISVSKGA